MASSVENGDLEVEARHPASPQLFVPAPEVSQLRQAVESAPESPSDKLPSDAQYPPIRADDFARFEVLASRPPHLRSGTGAMFEPPCWLRKWNCVWGIR